jgi:2-oxoacid:acceptor oxidoreductase gamma subunit (pyruvate/2-ketoisovalerate family)
MVEIRFHGRGGQGAVIGSEVLARAFFNEGRYVQSFPAFGVERRGAPVMACCRVDDIHINLRNQIYEPDHAVVLDATLIETGGVTKGLKKGGSILVNCRQDSNCFRGLIDTGFQLYEVDASSIAREYRLGSASDPIVNTSILGAFAKATGLVKIESVERAIGEYIPIKTEENKKAARTAYEQAVRK